MDELYFVLLSKEFSFLPSYPTFNSLADKALHNARTRLVK